MQTTQHAEGDGANADWQRASPAGAVRQQPTPRNLVTIHITDSSEQVSVDRETHHIEAKVCGSLISWLTEVVNSYLSCDLIWELSNTSIKDLKIF